MIEQFKKMDRRDKRIIHVFVLVILICIIIQLIVELELPDSQWAHVVLTLTLAILTSSLFALWDKLGLLAPIEQRIKELSTQITKELGDNANYVREIQEMNSEKTQRTMDSMIKTIDALDSYRKYQSAIYTYGFNEITGLDITTAENGDIIGIPTNFLANLIAEAGKNYELWYMTSFIKNDELYRVSIKRAVSNGAKIKLFLMMPSLDANVVSARYLDLYDRQYEDQRAFVDYIKSKASIFLGLRDELTRSSSQGGLTGG